MLLVMLIPCQRCIYIVSFSYRAVLFRQHTIGSSLGDPCSARTENQQACQYGTMSTPYPAFRQHITPVPVTCLFLPNNIPEGKHRSYASECSRMKSSCTRVCGPWVSVEVRSDRNVMPYIQAGLLNGNAMCIHLNLSLLQLAFRKKGV